MSLFSVLPEILVSCHQEMVIVPGKKDIVDIPLSFNISK